MKTLRLLAALPALMLVLPVFLPGCADPNSPDPGSPAPLSNERLAAILDLENPGPYPPAFSFSQLNFAGGGIGFDLDGQSPCGDPGVDNGLATRPLLVLALNLALAPLAPLALVELYGLNEASETTPLVAHVFPWGEFSCYGGQCEVQDFSDGQADHPLYSAFYRPGRFSWGPEAFDVVPGFRMLASRLDAAVDPDLSGMTGVVGGGFAAFDLSLIPNPIPPYEGSLVTLLVDVFDLWPDLDLNGDCVLDLEHDAYSAAALFAADSVVLDDYDGDGVDNDADGSGTPGDNPCRGYSGGCDDNCPRMANRYQEDADLDGIGNVCDDEPYLSLAPVLEGLDRPVDLAYSAGGGFGQFVYVSEEASGQVSRLAPDGRVSAFTGNLKRPLGLAFGEGGLFGTDLYVADFDDYRVKRIDPAGGVQTFSSFSSYYQERPVEILFDTDALENPRMLVTVQAGRTESRIKIFRADGVSESVILGSRLPMDVVKSPGGDWPAGFYVSVLDVPTGRWEILRVYEEAGTWQVTGFLAGLDGLRGIEFVSGEGGQAELFIAEFLAQRVVKADPFGNLQTVASGVVEPLAFLQLDEASGYTAGVLVTAQHPSTVFRLDGLQAPRRFAPPLVSPRDLLYVEAPFPEGLYVVEEHEGRIVQVDPDGNVTPFLTGLEGPVAMARGSGPEFGDYLYVTELAGGRILRADPAGAAEVFVEGLREPLAMAFGPGGEYGSFLYLTEQSEEKTGRVLRVDSLGNPETFAQWATCWPVDIDFLSWGGTGPDLYLTRTRMEGTSVRRELLSLDPAGAVNPGTQSFSRIALGFEMPDSGSLESMFLLAESDGRILGLLRKTPQGSTLHSVLTSGLPGEPQEVARVPEGLYRAGLYITLDSGDLLRLETD